MRPILSKCIARRIHPTAEPTPGNLAFEWHREVANGTESRPATEKPRICGGFFCAQMALRESGRTALGAS
jgi:hypothetical protein